MGDYVQGMLAVLNRHLGQEKPEEPWVIGIFGAWDSGKTKVLRAVENRLSKQLKPSAETTPTIPIWFNPGASRPKST